MLTRKTWAGVAMAALLAVTAASGSSGSSWVSDDEGSAVRGGQSDCSEYKHTLVFCGSAQCQGQSVACTVVTKLSSGTGTYARQVAHFTDKCYMCGVICTSGLQFSNWNPCTTPTTDGEELPAPGPGEELP